MKRSRGLPLTGLFFNTGNRFEKTVDESFDYSRDYIDKVTQVMLEEERKGIKRAKGAAEPNKTEQSPMPDPNVNRYSDPNNGQYCL